VNGTGALVPLERIQDRILVIRGQKVLLDSDLAELYGVPTKALNQAVKRNAERFPDDFVFQLESQEKSELVTNCDRFARLKHSNVLPYAFTEHGAIMAASVLRSARAVEVSIFVVRAFVRLRQMLASHEELARRLARIEKKLTDHDEELLMLIGAIRQLATPPPPEKRKRIGFAADRRKD
jgi:hypothetical protein